MRKSFGYCEKRQAVIPKTDSFEYHQILERMARAEADMDMAVVLIRTLEADLADRTKANEQLAAIGQSQFDRIRDLVALINLMRCDSPNQPLRYYWDEICNLATAQREVAK